MPTTLPSTAHPATVRRDALYQHYLACKARSTEAFDSWMASIPAADQAFEEEMAQVTMVDACEAQRLSLQHLNR